MLINSNNQESRGVVEYCCIKNQLEKERGVLTTNKFDPKKTSLVLIVSGRKLTLNISPDELLCSIELVW